MTESSVRVAVRIRPQMPNEVIDMCHVCTSVTPGEPQVWVGKDKAFTFDHVFNMTSAQEMVYDTCISDLIDGCFKGYNATILAYGQTGSGKTYTMGTGFDVSVNEEEKGIIPRAVHQLFEEIVKQQNEAQNTSGSPPEFNIVAQFMELYNEEIIDLLDPVRDTEDKGKRSAVKIHEDALGQISAVGLTSRTVTSASEALQCLKIGALSRTTASTKMNVQSSRSHAVFTLTIKQQRVVHFEPTDDSEKLESLNDVETLMSKLHFVDLAGSERLKRTGATGERAREGISINCGLLALGNVISALGDKTRKATHVPYRDSKLTRLLQDSLGGNSQTLMIACVSPSDRDFMETLNTLKYANRAKNIRNKISVNQDKSSQTIAMLRRENQQLQLELLEYKQGKRLIGENGEEQINDMFHENMFLESENDNLRSRLKALQETLDHQTKRVTDLLAEKASGNWIMSGENSANSEITELIKGYLKEIEDLRVKLMESEETCSQLRKQVQRQQSRLSFNTGLMAFEDHSLSSASSSPYELINEAKQEIKNLTKQAKALKFGKFEDNGNKEELKQITDDEKEKEDVPEDIDSKMNGNIQLDGEMDEDENDISSDDSDSEEKSSAETYSGDLAQLTHDISMKQKLIEALEQSQQRLRMMRHHYEEKLLQLEHKIKETENERDRVLANLSANKNNKSGEKVKKVKEEFENKLKNLQNELRKMQVVKKEHIKAMRNQAQYERQIQTLKNELAEMKKTKVRLINKMKEDNQKHLQAEQRRNREIAQLKKQSRMKENQIRSLEAEKRLKENVLKRKQEELMALRKSAKPMSDRVAGRVPAKDATAFIIHRRSSFSPKVAKSRWQSLEKSINQLAISKQSISCIERDMERYLEERNRLTRKLEVLKEKRNRAVMENLIQEIIQDYEDNIETLKANIDYCQENISECQSSIVQMEEAKEDIDVLDVEKLVSTLGMHEAKYLLGKLLNMTINQAYLVFQKDATIKEMEAKLTQSTDCNTIHMKLLQHLVEDGNAEVLDFIISNADPVSESQYSSRSSSPVDSNLSEVSTFYPASDCSKSKKRPRKTGLPTEFMMALEMKPSNLTPAGSCPSVAEPPEKPAMSRLAWSFGPALQQELDLDKTLTASDSVEDRGIMRVTSAPTSLQDMARNRKVEKSPLAKRRAHEKQSHMADFSPAFRRKFYTNASVIPPPSLSRQSSTETTVSDISPPNSPSGSRKSRDDNVFSRLTSGSFRLNKPGSGVIVPFSSKMNITKNSPLVCTHTAEGHSRAVISITATDDVLFSSSKDRTVKIWDLVTGKEIQSLGGHPNTVCTVRYSEYSRLAFSVSSAFIKVWDVRENPAKCIQTLSSSGASNSGTPALNIPSRTLQIPKGENQIHDIALNRYGTTLFSAAGNIVRIWDLRMYNAIGKLSGSHQAAIMCLAVDNEGSDKNTVVTGSKDHYIKVFEISEGTGGLHMAKTNLKPPHYDGIQSLAINGNILFSGSRDMCIKKWNLKTGSHIQSLNQAHKDWVCALSFLSNNSVLLSGCRGGFLKLWAADSTQLIGEIKAHSASINAISTNSSSIFTASSDSTVAFWRLKNNNDLSPDSSEYVDA